MEAIAALWKEVGTGVLLLLIILSNLDKIGRGIERVLSRIVPSIAEERRLKLEVQREALEHSRNTRERERQDTILALKEMLLVTREALSVAQTEHKESLAQVNIERKRCQAELVQVIVNNERQNAAQLDALISVNGTLQELSRILSRIAVRVGVYNDDNKEE